MNLDQRFQKLFEIVKGELNEDLIDGALGEGESRITGAEHREGRGHEEQDGDKAIGSFLAHGLPPLTQIAVEDGGDPPRSPGSGAALP